MIIKNIPKSILVVCTGNLYRSQIAEVFIAKEIIKANLTNRVNVTSAGLDAQPGQRVPEQLVSLLQKIYSIDLSLQHSKTLNFEQFLNADLVLVMEEQHIARLSKQFPRYTRKVRYISELTGKVYDIIDPVTHPDVNLNNLTEELNTLISSNVSTLLRWLKLI